MGEVFEKFKDLFSRLSFIFVNKRSRRLYDRFEVIDLLMITAELPDSSRIGVVDISYGGLFLNAPIEQVSKGLNSDGVGDLKLSAFRSSHHFKFQVMGARDGGTAIMFVHEKLEGLAWMRRFVEYLRVGGSMRLHSESRKGEESIEAYRGPNNTNLFISSKNEIVQRVDLAFSDEGIQSKLEWFENEVIFSRFDDQDDDSALALFQGFFLLYAMHKHFNYNNLAVVVGDVRQQLEQTTL